MLRVLLPLLHGDEGEDLGEEVLALLPAVLLPEVEHEVAGEREGYNKE